MLNFFRGKDNKAVEPAAEISTPKLFRGEVIQVVAPAGFDSLGKQLWKKRPVVVYQNTVKGSKIISVYCTTQKDPNDLTGSESIFVGYTTPEGIEMGLEKDTYIRPNNILFIEADSFVKPLGKCTFMDKIEAIKQNKMASR